MKKMLFIIPYANFGEQISKYEKGMYKIRNRVPFGPLSIISYCNKYSKVDTSFKIFDMNKLSMFELDKDEVFSQMISEINHFCPDIVGISALNNFMIDDVNAITKIVKKISNNTLIIGGGSGCMNNVKHIFANPDTCMDGVVNAEGEIPILNLINSTNIYDYIEHDNTFTTFQKYTNKITPTSELVELLDDIPPIDYSYIDMNQYTTVTDALVIEEKIREKDMRLPIVTTRGCPFNCVFCGLSTIHGKKFRQMTPERVYDDVKLLKDNFGITALDIIDDQALLDMKRAKKMLELLIPLNLSIDFYAGVTVRYIDDELAKLAALAGVAEMTLTFESGSEHILKDIIDKPLDLGNVKTSVSLLRKYGIHTKANLVIGFPGEREIDRQLTIDFVKEIGLDWVNILCATPYKGTRLYDICMSKGYVDEKKLVNVTLAKSIINTEEFTADFITEKAYLMNLELNFLNNYRLKIKDYDIAIRYFSHVLRSHPEHAFAHWGMCQAYKGKNDEIKSKKHEEAYKHAVEKYENWRHYAKCLKLE